MRKLLLIMSLFVFIGCDSDTPTEDCNSENCSAYYECVENKCVLSENRCSKKEDCENDFECNNDHFCINPMNPCEGQLCSNHGSCVVENNNAKCNCENGYHSDGLTCLINNPCSIIDCKAHASCIVEDNAGVCKCDNGYVDNNGVCEVTDLCNNVNCESHASCIVEDNAGVCKCDNGYVDNNGVCESDQSWTPIHTIRQEGVINNSYETVGIVTAIKDNNFWIQEANIDYGAIYCYQCGNYQVGNKLKITGTYIQYHDLAELKSATGITVESQSEILPDFKDVDATNISNMEPQESALVNFLNPPFTVTEAPSSSNYYNTEVKDINGNKFKIRGVLYHFENPSVGDRFNRLRGVLTYDHSEFKLYPRDESDMNSVNACEGVDCSGNGNCILTDNIATCNCTNGFHDIGLTCVEDDLTLCDGQLCSGNGSCEIINNEATCNCNEGFQAIGLTCVVLGTNELHLRLLSANMTDGNSQTYMMPQIRAVKSLKADVIMIQEFNYNSDASDSIRDLVDQLTDSSFFYSHGDGGIPNGIISRYTIYEMGFWDDPNIPNRDLDYAIIDIPGERDLFAVSVHLHTKPSSHQVIAANIIAQKISEHRSTHPGEYYYVVGGDFNGSSAVSDDGFGKYNGETIFITNAQHPIGEDGSTQTNKNRNKHYDWILATQDLNNLQVATKYCDTINITDCKTYTNGLVFDSRDFSQDELNKYFSPAQVNDSRNMQHMGIVKDFKILY